MQAHMSIRCTCPLTTPCRCDGEWQVEPSGDRSVWRATEDRDR